jgi:septum formation protein
MGFMVDAKTMSGGFILGSGSPRRREILDSLRIAYRLKVGRADETLTVGDTPERYLERVVANKLESVRVGEDDAGVRILVADTIVLEGRSILGKPADAEEARAMLTRLAGRTHEVRTRFALGYAGVGAPSVHEETVITHVTFRDIDADEISAYALTGEGMDKAGAYAVQGRAAAFVLRICGSYTNVVGLPACELVVALRRFGWMGS